MDLLLLLLQQNIETINGSINESWYNLELVIISMVIVYQVVHTIFLSIKIYNFKKLFASRLILKNSNIKINDLKKNNSIDAKKHSEIIDKNSDHSEWTEKGKNIPLVDVDSEAPANDIKSIRDTLNDYLINNYGAAVNFSIIKDIVDREVEVKDEDISTSITTPLYFGLAATMIGIIFGLLAMPDIGADNFNEGVSALIKGVKLAMSASLVGLACTTIMSSFFYKNAKRIVLKDKNSQLSYLQATLLPELVKAEDTGVSGLKASLDRFARVATEISDNVLIAANQTGENILLQQEVISKVENIGMLRISKTNLELLDKLEKNMSAFSKFSTYIATMENIASNLKEFASRTSNIDQVIIDIDSTLKQSRELLKFLAIHFEKIEGAGNAALKTVGLAEEAFQYAISELKKRTDEMIQHLYKSSGDHEIKLKEIYGEIEKSIHEVTSKHIDNFIKVYENSVPQFDKLDHLAVLPEISNTFLPGINESQNDSMAKLNKLIESLSELSHKMSLISGKIENPSILQKLDLIEKNQKADTRRESNPRPIEVKSTKLPTTTGKENNEKLNIRDLLKAIFSNNKS